MSNIERIGEIGEQIVSDLLNARLSEDKFDRKKDMTDNDGNEIEVKTQVRSSKTNSFTVLTNQLPKCVNVDRLLFVEYGTYGHIRVYECIDRNYNLMRTADGRYMAHFKIDKMIKIYDKQNDLCQELVKLSNSNIKWLDGSKLYQL